MKLDSQQIDDRIRAALSDAYGEGLLGNLASNIGIAGGEKTLREIMETPGPLHSMDRGMLAIYFRLN